MPFVGVGVTHNSSQNWGRIDDLNLRAFSFGSAAAYPAKFASLNKLDELVALAQRCPVFVAEVVSCFHGRFGKRAIGEPCEVLDEFVIFDGDRTVVQIYNVTHDKNIPVGVGAARPRYACGGFITVLLAVIGRTRPWSTSHRPGAVAALLPWS